MNGIGKSGFYVSEEHIETLFVEYEETFQEIQKEIDFFKNQYKQAIIELRPEALEEEKEQLYSDAINAYNPEIDFCKYLIGVQITNIKNDLNRDLIHYLGDSFEYFSIMHESMFDADNPLEQSKEAIKKITKMKTSYVFENQPLIEIELTIRVLHALHVLKEIENGLNHETKKPLYELQLLVNYFTKLIPNFNDIEYYKSTLALSNKHRQTINRESNEKELKEKALDLFKIGHPTQNRKWKNRTEFKNYFLVTHNSSVKNEKEWVKDATLNRWIKEFFSIEK
ncbi:MULTISPECIES: hypothetical protein [unclassified Acinetobacter]|uniref:hypothetical protein n=1 Tax=unclassified Acinetobacter TaxID=196816 RepID=UPI00257647EF|nr:MULTISPECIES: hypothetical protein [unclassified Acinetobacter]MDM1763382.1 hypothetical protein [Acinetobacter sp. 226-1]MDM1766861.1 hypothetical protein [Acinetobacter sp. 226-4]